MSSYVSLYREISLLNSTIRSLSSYQVDSITLTHSSEAMFTIEPNDGYWKGGRYPFLLTFKDYPVKPPAIRCLDLELKHPNIEAEGYICLNIIEEDVWNSSFRIVDVIQGLLFLFHYPNFADGLTGDFGFPEADEEHEEEFCRKARGIVNKTIEKQRERRRKEAENSVNFIESLAKQAVSRAIYGNENVKSIRNLRDRMMHKKACKVISLN